MGTYDGYWDMRDQEYCKSDQYLGIYRSSSPVLSEKEKEALRPFKPIAARFSAKNWKATRTQQGTDIRFRVKDQEFSAHKIKVAASSDYFYRLLPPPALDNLETEQIVEIKDMDPVIFKNVLKFIYTGTMGKKFQKSMVDNITILFHTIVSAEKMEVDGIVQWSAQLVKEHLRMHPKIGTNHIKEFFIHAFKNNSQELLEVLFEFGKDSRTVCEEALRQAVFEASSNNLITAELWKALNAVFKDYRFREILDNCIKYNPLLQKINTKS